MQRYDAIIVGLGAMGSATAYSLAQRGHKVLGLEQFTPAHAKGSSHGKSRVIRTAYYEHPSYVPLCVKALESWRKLEKHSGKKLLTMTGCLNLGPAQGELIAGVKASALQHHLAVDVLTPSEVQKRFTPFRVPEDWVGVYEHNAGALAVEDCVQAQWDMAVKHGADVRAEEAVLKWTNEGNSVRVTTTKGEYVGGRLIVTAGAWASVLLKDVLKIPLTVMRQVMLWFAPNELPLFQPKVFPVFLADTASGAFYGMPALDHLGVKVARHFGAPELANPNDVNWETTDADETPVQEFNSQFLPTLKVKPQSRQVCMYTLTPDRHFVVDALTDHVIVAGGFSGHGFKFAPVIGEILADLFEHGRTMQDISLFRADRFAEVSS